MDNPKILLSRIKAAFSFGCFTLAIYYGITQVVRYIENKDTSTITQRTFNDAANNKYPTITICLKGKEIYWRNEHTLFDRIEMTSLQYTDLLKGNNGWRYKYDEIKRLYYKEHLNESSIFKLGFSDVFLHPSDIIVGTHFLARNDIQSTHYGYGEEKVNLVDIPFQIGYRTPDETCFTRDSSDDIGLIRVYDEILLNRSLLDPGSNQNLEAKIIFHYPGQLIDRIKTPSHRFALKEMSPDDMF